jgi:DNA-binding response OmpR family regulator
MTSQKIVIIDDDNELRETLGDILQEEGFEATTFSNDDCLSTLHRIQPDLILVDYWLAPDHTSEIFIKQVRQNNELKNTPIILMSNDRNIIKRSESSAVEAFLPKPFEIEKLVRTIRTLVG